MAEWPPILAEKLQTPGGGTYMYVGVRTQFFQLVCVSECFHNKMLADAHVYHVMTKQKKLENRKKSQ